MINYYADEFKKSFPEEMRLMNKETIPHEIVLSNPDIEVRFFLLKAVNTMSHHTGTTALNLSI